MSSPTEKSPLLGSEPLTNKTHPTRQETELRAYEIYIERGCADGHDVDDWLQAEHEQAEHELAERAQSEHELFEKYANIGRIARGVGA